LAESKVDIGKRKNPKTMSFVEDDEENDSTPASQTTHETRQSPWQTSADPYAYSQEEGR
jgi:hypothetical protein